MKIDIGKEVAAAFGFTKKIKKKVFFYEFQERTSGIE